MFFDYNQVSSKLACSFCGAKFSDVVKLIPQCGNSICGDCYEALTEELADSRQFSCKACDHEAHKMAEEGLPNNKAVLQLLQVRPLEKGLNDKTKRLKSSISDLQQRVELLKSFDADAEINTYCDILESEVTLSLESAIKHLTVLKDGLLKQIKDYRRQSLSSSNAKTSCGKLLKELDVLSEKLVVFEQPWSDYFNQVAINLNDEKIDTAQQTVNDFKSQASSIDASLRNTAFQNNFMTYKQNESFFKSTGYLGELVVPQPKQATQAEPKPERYENLNISLPASVSKANHKCHKMVAQGL